MDYVVPKQLVAEMLEAARNKAALSARDLMIRGGSLYITGAPLYLPYGASPQRGKEPVPLESKSAVGLAAEGA
ncbi:MAG: hypothetical protein WB762_18100 [Candidatus Sulfotelmatobacter sp.]